MTQQALVLLKIGHEALPSALRDGTEASPQMENASASKGATSRAAGAAAVQ